MMGESIFNGFCTCPERTCRFCGPDGAWSRVIESWPQRQELRALLGARSHGSGLPAFERDWLVC